MDQQRFDAAIVGGGLAGLFTALAFAREGDRVVVLDKGGIGAHASSLNVGGVRRIGREPQELELADRAMRFWTSLNAATAGAAGFRACGHLILAETEDEVGRLRGIEAGLHRAGMRLTRWVEPEAMRDLVPSLRAGPLAGLFAAEDGMADPRLTVAAITRMAEAAGVTLMPHAPVRALKRVGGEWRVSSDARAVTAPIVVNAAGADGAHVARLLGDELPIRIEAPLGLRTAPVAPLLGPVVQTLGRKLTIKQLPDGRLLIGGGHRGVVNEAGGTVGVPLGEVRENLATARDLFPAIGDVTVEDAWGGLDGYTPDRIPILDASPAADGVFHAIGFSGHGFQIAPAVGPALHALARGRRPDVDLAPFAATRFEGRPARFREELRVG